MLKFIQTDHGYYNSVVCCCHILVLFDIKKLELCCFDVVLGRGNIKLFGGTSS
jgi:hypothetical protein